MKVSCQFGGMLLSLFPIGIMTSQELSDHSMNMGIYFCFSICKGSLPLAFSHPGCLEIFRGDLWNLISII